MLYSMSIFTVNIKIYVKYKMNAYLRVWKRVGGGGGADPTFPLLFHKNPVSRTFYILNPIFLSQKNTLKITKLISTKAKM